VGDVFEPSPAVGVRGDHIVEDVLGGARECSGLPGEQTQLIERVQVHGGHQRLLQDYVDRVDWVSADGRVVWI
jgi:hypothetical protein